MSQSRIILDPHLEVLACCARTHLDANANARLQRFAQSKLDWDLIADLARRHGVLPLLHRNLPQAAGNLIKEAVRQRVRTEAYSIATFNHYLSRELLAIVQQLKAASIEALPLKGPVLSELAYGSVTHRQFVDLDFLVKRDDFVAAVRLLEAAGYRAKPERSAAWQAAGLWRLRYHQPFFHPERTILVELHQALVEPYFSSAPVDTIWTRLQNQSFLDGEVWWMGPEDQLVYLSTHASKHAWNRLGWICDIAELLRSTPDLDWNRVLRGPASEPTRYMVATGLRLASDLFDAPIAGSVEHLVQRDRRVERLAESVLKSLNASVEQARRPAGDRIGESTDAREIYFQFRIQSTLPARLRFCRRLALEKLVVSWATRPLPPHLDWLYRFASPRLGTAWGLWVGVRALAALTYYLTLPAAKWIRSQTRRRVPTEEH